MPQERREKRKDREIERHQLAQSHLGTTTGANVPPRNRTRELGMALGSSQANTTDWTEHPWPALPKARDLCRQLLRADPEQRGAAAGAVNKGSKDIQGLMPLLISNDGCEMVLNRII